ncbi:polyprenyl synthetase family protein [Sciscionella sediminilitoris]|uniref:polyprenyl synthetase family protein n=1 Tax=Sciscionella sediminilitoris TaxID=1445613 RepID=UPI0004DECFC0|nr:polyprenyl synthetase family protein [Sciscionella sp. SE31]
MTAVMPSELTEARELVTPALRSAIDRLDGPTARVCRYHFGWEDTEGKPSTPGGKTLRPALALLSAQAAGSRSELGVPAGAAVELVHNFSLLHDDVMDGDVERRHRATAWRVFGVPAAILAGDAMLTVAVDTVREAYQPDRAVAVEACLTTAVRRLIAGQSADVSFESRADVSVEECVRMERDKTSALLACASSIGAVAAGADETTVHALDAFGEHLGIAFQMVDDLLGIWGASEVTGKPALSDLTSRKKSVPVLAAMDSGTSAGDELRERYGNERETDVALLATLIEKAGGREWTSVQADEHVRSAIACLDEIDLSENTRAAFELTARFVTERDL